MPDRAVLQPNGRYAIFSSNVDNFTAYDGTRGEIRDAFVSDFTAAAIRNAEDKLKRADERDAARPGEDFNAAIRSIATVHGFDESERLKALLSEPVPARGDEGAPPQAEPELPPASAVNHATGPLVKPERRTAILSLSRSLQLLCEAYGVRIKGDTDASGDILIFDQNQKLPHGYEWSAYIEPGGQLAFCDYVLDDESGATEQ